MTQTHTVTHTTDTTHTTVMHTQTISLTHIHTHDTHTYVRETTRDIEIERGRERES